MFNRSPRARLRSLPSAGNKGFATEFFDGSNTVVIGSDSYGYVSCDVIEGACTVDCGSAWRIVCDTGEWVNDADNGAMDVVVTIDEVGAGWKGGEGASGAGVRARGSGKGAVGIGPSREGAVLLGHPSTPQLCRCRLLPLHPPV